MRGRSRVAGVCRDGIMAVLSTRNELDEEIKQLQDVRKLMMPDQLVCLKCKTIYPAEERSSCFCDYESDRSFE
jgi:sialic acid synthase SpsE